jgi:hypothetical protein
MPTGLPSPVEKVEPKQEVQAEVKTEVEPKVEVKAEVKAETSDNLLDGISDEPQTIEQAQEEEPKEYPPEIRSMKAREHFDALKASKKAAERRAQELEAKVKDLESKGGIKAPEVAVALKERDEYKALWEESQKEMGISHIQGLTAFKTLDAKLTETRTFFQKVATQYEFSTAELDEALSEPDEFIRDKKLAEIADNIGSELTKRKFFDRIDPFLKDLDSMDELYKNAEGSMEFAKTQKEQEEAAAKLKAADEYAEARKVAFGHLKPRMTEIQEDPAVWEKVIADAESVDWDTLPPKMKAFAAVAMQSIQPYQAKVKALGEKVKHLEGVIASRNASSPGATGGSVTARSSENKGDFLEGMPGL